MNKIIKSTVEYTLFMIGFVGYLLIEVIKFG